jgi:hypothetical protein
MKCDTCIKKDVCVHYERRHGTVEIDETIPYRYDFENCKSYISIMDTDVKCNNCTGKYTCNTGIRMIKRLEDAYKLNKIVQTCTRYSPKEV